MSKVLDTLAGLIAIAAITWAWILADSAPPARAEPDAVKPIPIGVGLASPDANDLEAAWVAPPEKRVINTASLLVDGHLDTLARLSALGIAAPEDEAALVQHLHLGQIVSVIEQAGATDLKLRLEPALGAGREITLQYFGRYGVPWRILDRVTHEARSVRCDVIESDWSLLTPRPGDEELQLSGRLRLFVPDLEVSP